MDFVNLDKSVPCKGACSTDGCATIGSTEEPSDVSGFPPYALVLISQRLLTNWGTFLLLTS